MLTLDGSYGEGGGQIVRSAVTLSAITGRAVRIHDIRAGRPKPGLAAQHLTAVRAAAAICEAEVAGDVLGGRTLEFAPTRKPGAGDYAFDVGAARPGGSAGAAALVMQSVLVPLALADARSTVSIAGGTHMAWSPPYDYVRDVWLPALQDLGIDAQVALDAWGWFPLGRGLIRVSIKGRDEGTSQTRSANWDARGPMQMITGRAVSAELPRHIAERMADRAGSLLRDTGAEVSIEAHHVEAACPGAGIFLTAHYEFVRCGFSALGRRGLPAEQVAEQAVAELLDHDASDAALEPHLADQVLIPLALAPAPSSFSTQHVSRHLTTNAWIVERFGLARLDLMTDDRGCGQVTVTPGGAA
jgi:RNA 3'-terminal phosphate cyclase (ATP)